MIWDSNYWKAQLHRNALRIMRGKCQKGWSEASAARLEHDVMVGFYALRKLAEAHKVSDDITHRRLSMLAYRWTGHPVTFLNWDNIDQHYALANPTHVDRGVVWIANQLIHSFVFIPAFEDSGILEKILFNSDRTRLDYLFSISIDSIISLFEEVASNDPDSMALTFDVSKRDYKVFVGPAIERE